jgi:hypothetical protein
VLVLIDPRLLEPSPTSQLLGLKADGLSCCHLVVGTAEGWLLDLHALATEVAAAPVAKPVQNPGPQRQF